jgi:hypothetical protein
LSRLFERLEPGPRILVTHYPICLASGQPESHVHGLRNLSDLVRIAAEGKVSLWLHGHRHGTYFVQQPPTAPFPVICAGSATQTRRWSYGEYTIDGWGCKVQPRVFDPQARGFRDAEAYTLEMPHQ